MGYLTLDREGTIRETNLTGASLLGIEPFSSILHKTGSNAIGGSLPYNTDITRI